MSIKKIILSAILLFSFINFISSQNISATIKAGSCDSCIVLYFKSSGDAKVVINNFNVALSVDAIYSPVIEIKNDSLLTEGNHLSTASFDYSGKSGSILNSYVLNGRRCYDIIYNNSSSTNSIDSTLFLNGVEHPIVELKLSGLNNHTLLDAKVQFNDLTYENGGSYLQSYCFASIAGKGNDGSGSLTPLAPSNIFYSNPNQCVVGSNSVNDQFVQLTSIIQSLPISTLALSGSRMGSKVNILWKVNNERNITRYNIERSENGNLFKQLFSTMAINSSKNKDNNYNGVDEFPLPNSSYYRIKSIRGRGDTIVSNVIKIGPKNEDIIDIYPNPINATGFNLKITKCSPGVYFVRMNNLSGKSIFEKSFINNGKGYIFDSIKWREKLIKGVYYLEVLKPDHTIATITLVY